MQLSTRNKHAALQYKLKKRKELISRVERTLRQIHRLEQEIQQIHGQDENTAEQVYEALHEPRSLAEA